MESPELLADQGMLEKAIGFFELGFFGGFVKGWGEGSIGEEFGLEFFEDVFQPRVLAEVVELTQPNIDGIASQIGLQQDLTNF